MSKKILFDAEFDSNVFNQGIDEMISALKKAKDEEDKLANSLANVQQELDKNKSAAEKAEKELSKLSKSTADTSKSQDELKAKMEVLRKEEEKLAKTYTEQSKKLSDITKQSKIMEQTYSDVTTAVKELQKETGKPLDLSLDTSSVVESLQKIDSSLVGDFNLSGFDELREDLESATDEFDELRSVIKAGEKELELLDPGSEKFQELSEIVRTGKAYLEQYDQTLEDLGDTTEVTGEKQLSLRTRLANVRNELAAMEDAGKANTAAFERLQLEAASLQDQYGDLQARIQILASDTRALDFGVAAFTAGAAAAEGAMGALELFGLSSLEAEEAQRKLLSIMALVQSAQELQNALNKDSVLIVNGQRYAQQALAVTQKGLAKAFGTTTASVRLFSAALLATGIGALIVTVGLLVVAMKKLKNRQAEIADQRERNNKLIEAEASATADSKFEIEALKIKIDLAKKGYIEKTKVLEDYNSTLGKTIGKAKDINSLEQILINKASIYIKVQQLKAKADAARAIATQKAKEAVEAQLKKDIDFASDITRFQNNINQLLRGKDLEGLDKEFIEKRRKKAITEAESDYKDALKLFENFSKEAAKLEKENGFVTEKSNSSSSSKRQVAEQAKEITNIYEQEQKKLKEKLTQITATDFVDENTIREQAQKNYDTYADELSKAVKEKKLTIEQSNSLLASALEIRDIEIANATNELKEAQKKVIQEAQAEIDQLNEDNSDAEIQQIKDQFEQRKAIIADQLDDRNKQLEEANKIYIDKLNEQYKQGLISAEDLEQFTTQAEAALKQAYEIANAEAASAYQSVSFDAFQQSLDTLDEALKGSNLVRLDYTREEIQEVANLYLASEITFEEYQSRLTAIVKKETRERLREQLQAVDEEIKQIQERINSGVGVDEAFKLNKRLIDAKTNKDGLERDLLSLDVDDKNKTDQAAQEENDGRLGRLLAYTEAIGGLVGEIVNFWAIANQAEQESLDRSLAIQAKRVEAAQRIAERGNAEYLRMEEDRERELQVKRENAARKQLAVNAALQASQLLVAVTGAVAKIASGAGALDVIASIGTIVGALGAGYALVNSLKDQQPSFFDGDPYVRRDFTKNSWVTRKNEPKGRDTIPAWLDEGEAVTAAATADLYRPTIEAIHNHDVPPELLNSFVTGNYPVLPNYGIAKESVKVQARQEKQMLSELRRNNHLLVKQNELLNNMSTTVTVDENGVAVSVMSVMSGLSIGESK